MIHHRLAPLLALCLAVSPAWSSEQKTVPALLQELRASKKSAVAASIETRIKQAKKHIQEHRDRVDHPVVFVGRLIVDGGKHPPTEVFAQMPVDSNGYFVSSARDRERPVGFWLDGPLASNRLQNLSADP